ncbi:MAG: putative oligopeptide transporter (OPT) family protein [Pseudohongiellaceae bacterium]|jgi:uncharacterized oligopeptide transporter (OPT) family protein
MSAAPSAEPAEAKPAGYLPPLRLAEWVTFAVLAAILAAANIYTTLLIGWGDTGSIIAVMLSVLILGVISPVKPSVHTLNLGQTMVSAGGSVGFAVASYAAVRIIQPDFKPDTSLLVVLFAAMGMLGAIIGSTVRKQMVRYFFPSGTACAVIQTAVTKERAEGERNRPMFLLKLWGTVAALLTIPVKLTGVKGDTAWVPNWMIFDGAGERWAGKGVGLGVDPLYYGIGIVVGPRVGIGMLIGALVAPFILEDYVGGMAAFTYLNDLGNEVTENAGDWNRWLAIAVMTLPTFGTIIFAYMFHQPASVPPGFTPGKTHYQAPAGKAFVYGLIGALAALAIGWSAQLIFDLPWHVAVITIAIAWPLCVVNGRVTGDTDINPVRLVAIVLLSGFFWLISSGTIAMLGMAVVGGTLAAAAVDMMQDYRTGYLVDANPTHQTTVQFFGAVVGAFAAIPVLNMLVDAQGIGAESTLPAPGAQVWAAMAEAMTGGFEPSGALLTAILVVSVVGTTYAFLTVWPKTAKWMPSIFGIGIGMLVGVPTSAGIFVGGLIKGVASWGYTRGKSGTARDDAASHAGNDTMLAGASVFAAAAILSILLIVVIEGLAYFGLHPFYMAQ